MSDDIHDKAAERAANAYFAPFENAIKAFESAPNRETAMELQAAAQQADQADLIDRRTFDLIMLATRAFLTLRGQP